MSQAAQQDLGSLRIGRLCPDSLFRARRLRALRRDPRVTVMLEHFPRDVSGDLHDRLIARAAFRNVSLSTSSAEFKSSQMAKSPPRPIAFEPVETACMQPPDWFSNTSAWERSSLSLNLSRNRF
jgi:hypothetical protein